MNREEMQECHREQSLEQARKAIVLASSWVGDAKMRASNGDAEDLDAVRACVEAGLYIFDAIQKRADGEDQDARTLILLAKTTIMADVPQVAA